MTRLVSVGGVSVVVGCVGGDASEFASSHAVGVALEGVDLGMVDQAVDHGSGDGVVAEDLAPANWGWHLFLMGWVPGDLAVSGV